MTVRPPRPRSPRRGVTLVEMLVTVALLVLLMSVLVKVFAAATGAVSAAKTYAELDGQLRRLEATLRADLGHVTARFSPPLDPAKNLGYFEYGENSFADLQGEDGDDYLKFTVRASEGRLFTGRMVAPPNPPPYSGTNLQTQTYFATYFATQPITITSQFAEVIYFLRNGNLYRRVLLVAPERQSSISPPNQPPLIPPAGANAWFSSVPFLSPNGNGLLPVSWQGLNDLSARPSTSAGAGLVALNTLGDLTNRENRAFVPRFVNDYVVNAQPSAGYYGDGVPDDEDTDAQGNLVGNGIPDFYPTLYGGVFASAMNGSSKKTLIWEFPSQSSFRFNHFSQAVLLDNTAFPYIFPGAYSQPDPYSAQQGYGWIHTPDPTNTQLTVQALDALNHNPLDGGDSLPVPLTSSQYQTWWGFPTWRETLGASWTDPLNQWTNNGVSITGQGYAQHSVIANAIPASVNALVDPGNLGNMLPPMTPAFRLIPQPATDGAGESFLAVNTSPFLKGTDATAVWTQSWEDDLIMTNVRSFDVKAYDSAFGGFVDLGWGDDLRLYQGYASGSYTPPTAPPLLAGTPLAFAWPPTGNATLLTQTETYAHEGRIPPRIADLRFDAQYHQRLYPPGPYQSNVNGIYDGNVGDDNGAIVRLRRVWDTWSTAYTNAPAVGYDPTSFAPIGPPYTPPVYPSYPPPYPMPLRGIQIQIRVVDPRNERIKVLTLREDFTDRL